MEKRLSLCVVTFLLLLLFDLSFALLDYQEQN